MTTVQFLADWALRSSILIASGALLITAFRLKNSSIRLAAWTALLCGSLAIPAFTAAFPRLPVTVSRTVVGQVATPAEFHPEQSTPAGIPAPQPVAAVFNWSRAALTVYSLGVFALLLRICVGLAMSRRLLRRSRPTGQSTEGIEIRESERVAAPVTLGIVRPAILLPPDWREWDKAKLAAVLAHERSHITRRDPAVQLLSALHRALLWHSPLSWFLHQRLVRVAEEASDDAAMTVSPDRASYAEVLLGFMQRGVRNTNYGISMARYGRVELRILRILEGTTLSRGVTRRSVIAIVALASPLAYFVATAYPQTAAAPPATNSRTSSPAPPASAPVKSAGAPKYIEALGSVAASVVTVRSPIDGQLTSLNFKEGEPVQQGQVLAYIGKEALGHELELAQERVVAAQEEAETMKEQAAAGQGMEAAQRARENVARRLLELQELEMQFSHKTEIKAPVSGIAGLRLVEPGNTVHPSDPTGIVTIAQVEPITLIFTVPQDWVPQVRALLNRTPAAPVEAWNRDNKIKLATGHLTAIDNQIDEKTGTVKLKAVFENKDRALFPNQFVNVRLLNK